MNRETKQSRKRALVVLAIRRKAARQANGDVLKRKELEYRYSVEKFVQGSV